MSAKKLVVRLKGGLGNQMFQYAAGRRLSLVNNAELIIDNVSGFVRDRNYRRKFMLDRFCIPVRKATSAERMEPLERYRRGVMKWISRRKPFAERRYLEQEEIDFDERLLSLKVNHTLYLDGYWQSEDYFKDVEQTVRKDLQILPPLDALNQDIARQIRNSQAVALHIRWFDAPDFPTGYNVSDNYYQRAIALMESKINLPHYFMFSDNPEAARVKLALPNGRGTVVSHNQGDNNAYADLWLMTQCRHFIIANSTFSWWGAWLGGTKEKIVVSPQVEIQEGKTAWNFSGQIPSSWLKI